MAAEAAPLRPPAADGTMSMPSLEDGSVAVASAQSRSQQWAYWTAWRGSPKLVARIAQLSYDSAASVEPPNVGQRTAGSSPGLLITVTTARDTERFTDVSEFLSRLTPEAQKRFRRVEIEVERGPLTLKVRLLRGRLRLTRYGLSRGELVTLGVESDTAADANGVTWIAQRIAQVMARGYRRWSGRRQGSSPQVEDALGVSFSRFERLLLQFGVSAAVGFGLVSTIESVLTTQIAPLLLALAGVAATSVYAVIVAMAIPRVELEGLPDTRLASVAKRTSQILVSFAATQALTRGLLPH